MLNASRRSRASLEAPTGNSASSICSSSKASCRDSSGTSTPAGTDPDDESGTDAGAQGRQMSQASSPKSLTSVWVDDSTLRSLSSTSAEDRVSSEQVSLLMAFDCPVGITETGRAAAHGSSRSMT